MALLDILEFPDARLRKKAKPINNVDGKIINLAEQMLETMYLAPGIGLAATQVNVHLQLLVVDVSEDKDQPNVLINPSILSSDGEIETSEGCLSVPGFYEPVIRSENITFEAVGLDGEVFERKRRVY